MIGISEDTPCHDAFIEVVMIHDDQIITAGADGYVKYWKIQKKNILRLIFTNKTTKTSHFFKYKT